MKDQKLVYSCACTSNLGRISSCIVKLLDDRKIAKVIPLPDPFSDDSIFIKNAREAKMNISIDGCQVGCAHKALKIRKIEHKQFFLTEMGCEKNKTEVNDGNVEKLFNEIKSKIGDSCA